MLASAAPARLGNIPPQDWDWITSVNFLGMAYYVTEVLPIMKEQGTEAHFLFTVSIGGLQPVCASSLPTPRPSMPL